MTTKIIAATMMAALATSSLFADKVTLKSGSFLTGEADVIRDGVLTFKSEDLGEIEIDIKNIVSLESDRDHVVQYNDESKETKKLTIDDGALVVNENGEPTLLDMSTVKATDPEEEKWHGSVNVSATATRGNTVGESATVLADASRRWEKDRLTLSGGYYFAQSGDSKQTKQKTVSRFEAQAQEDHFWTGKGFYTYINGKYEFDRIMDLKYRWRLGAGLGYQWFEKRDFGLGKMSFNQELGGSYIGEKYDHMSEDNYGAFRYAHHFFAWSIFGMDDLDFVHNFEYIPQVDEWQDNYMLDMDFGLTYAFRANWQLIAKAEWDYKSKVGDNTKHSDIRYILGLGYKW
ncbi:MAG: DUF481 domain-containing protein [Kiritimatiellae bacterium]|nr:DUF481 domain-containing protein [Kiritimatiellia bacterium]